MFRDVHNPMILGVFRVLLGEAALLGSQPLLIGFAVFVTLNLIYILLIEEPVLIQRFGEECLLYRQNVPRWIPRLHPWNNRI